jgi:carbohydrate-binding DOMON domain-containing protein
MSSSEKPKFSRREFLAGVTGAVVGLVAGAAVGSAVSPRKITETVTQTQEITRTATQTVTVGPLHLHPRSTILLSLEQVWLD